MIPSEFREGRVLIEFRLLGPVEVWRRPGGAGRAKAAGLLAALLVRVGRVVSLDQLIDELWPDRPPARATATLPRAQLPATSAPGYVLRADPGTIDALEFVRLAAEGRAAPDAGPAAELLARAEGRWRGAALADVDTPFAQAEAARLEELRLCCAEDRVDAELTMGRHTAVVAELEQRVHAHPLRERSRAQLMVALYRAGRHADALTVYGAGATSSGRNPGRCCRRCSGRCWAATSVAPGPAARPLTARDGRRPPVNVHRRYCRPL